MRYAPGKVPTKPLPAAPSRPGVKPTITGAPATPITPKPMGALTGMRPQGLGTTGGPLVKPRPPGMKKGGKVSSASKRADGIATKGKTKGKIV